MGCCPLSHTPGGCWMRPIKVWAQVQSCKALNLQGAVTGPEFPFQRSGTCLCLPFHPMSSTEKAFVEGRTVHEVISQLQGTLFPLSLPVPLSSPPLLFSYALLSRCLAKGFLTEALSSSHRPGSTPTPAPLLFP